MPKVITGCRECDFGKILFSNSKNKNIMWINRWTRSTTRWQLAQLEQVGKLRSKRIRIAYIGIFTSWIAKWRAVRLWPAPTPEVTLLNHCEHCSYHLGSSRCRSTASSEVYSFHTSKSRFTCTSTAWFSPLCWLATVLDPMLLGCFWHIQIHSSQWKKFHPFWWNQIHLYQLAPCKARSKTSSQLTARPDSLLPVKSPAPLTAYCQWGQILC